MARTGWTIHCAADVAGWVLSCAVLSRTRPSPRLHDSLAVCSLQSTSVRVEGSGRVCGCPLGVGRGSQPPPSPLSVCVVCGVGAVREVPSGASRPERDAPHHLFVLPPPVARCANSQKREKLQCSQCRSKGGRDIWLCLHVRALLPHPARRCGCCVPRSPAHPCSSSSRAAAAAQNFTGSCVCARPVRARRVRRLAVGAATPSLACGCLLPPQAVGGGKRLLEPPSVTTFCTSVDMARWLLWLEPRRCASPLCICVASVGCCVV